MTANSTGSEDAVADCLFCKIAAGAIPSDQVYEDDAVIAFRDIAPQAPVHVLVVPRRHVSSLDGLRDDPDLAGRLLTAAANVARLEGVHATGYRVAVNHGRHGAQTVGHVHLHVLGGRQLHGELG
ncbi:MAG: histidine triad nucleotide-binding protein [Chloroflexi bacterium]|nr:histidine triad nucleotide-binding protein [Chloroflexota bacterium]